MPTALITGASSGIGLELAKCFAKDKHNVILAARSEDKLQDLATQLRSEYAIESHVIPADLSQQNAASSLFEKVKESNLHVDYLINNAGIGDYDLFHKADWLKLETMINLNMLSLTHLTHLFLPAMIEKGGGRIMNVASTAAFQPGPTMAVYFATKAYVLSFSEALRYELRKKNITVTCLAPGATKSEFQSTAAMEESDFVKNSMATSEEVAKFGYKALMAGKGTVVHGAANRFLAFGTRLLPRQTLAAATEKIMGKIED